MYLLSLSRLRSFSCVSFMRNISPSTIHRDTAREKVGVGALSTSFWHPGCVWWMKSQKQEDGASWSEFEYSITLRWFELLISLICISTQSCHRFCITHARSFMICCVRAEHSDSLGYRLTSSENKRIISWNLVLFKCHSRKAVSNSFITAKIIYLRYLQFSFIDTFSFIALRKSQGKKLWLCWWAMFSFIKSDSQLENEPSFIAFKHEYAELCWYQRVFHDILWLVMEIQRIIREIHGQKLNASLEIP